METYLNPFVAHIWYMLQKFSKGLLSWLRTDCYAAVRAALEAEPAWKANIPNIPIYS